MLANRNVNVNVNIKFHWRVVGLSKFPILWYKKNGNIWVMLVLDTAWTLAENDQRRWMIVLMIMTLANEQDTVTISGLC